MAKEKTDGKDNKIANNSRIQNVPITRVMQKSYLDYAMSVIVARALPDVRDGLKPVQRRIIFAMYKQGMTAGAAYKKCAAVVGEVMKEYHPHGDQAIYHTLVRMAQDFSLRYPLIDGQGNFGSVDGDSPAAMRYTECRLEKITGTVLEGIQYETVPFVANYSGETEEPVILPSLLPNLLINGAAGIAVGMATNIPPHNLGEIIDALTLLISKGDAIKPQNGDEVIKAEGVSKEISFQSSATIEELMGHIQGPDLPTGGAIYDIKEIRHAYTTGRGNIVMRGITNIEEGKNHKMSIIITELPYQVNKANLIIKIANLVKKDKIKGISDLRDESDRHGMRVVIELKRDLRPQRVLNQLYKHTDLQKTFNANMVGLVNGEPKVLTLKLILVEFIKHRQLIVIKRTLFLLRKAKEREHILEGLMIALDNLDAVIETIKKSKDAETAKKNLIKKFKLSDIQAQAILDMQLRKLAALEQQKIRDELAEIKEKIAEHEKLIASPKEVLKVITRELSELKEKYGDPRKTKLYKRGLKEMTDEDLVPDEDVIITLTENGYIKRLKAKTYKTQGRGGKGVKGMKTKEEDVVTRVMFANTHDRLLFFTDKGKVYMLPVHEIPEASRTAKGTALVNVIDISQGETPQSIVKLRKESSAKYIVFSTKKGRVKRTPISEFEKIRKSGKVAIRLQEGDELCWVHCTSGQDEILLATSEGMSIRFKETDLRPMGRAAGGVRGIKIKKKDDSVVGMAIVDPKAWLLVATEKGFGKLSKIKSYTLQKRGGSGILTAKVTDRIGRLVTARMVTNRKADLLMTSTSGQVIREPLKDISILGRATQGVKLIKLNKGDRLAAVTLVQDTKMQTGEEGEKQVVAVTTTSVD